jgi:hypothetical protein
MIGVTIAVLTIGYLINRCFTAEPQAAYCKL